MDLNKALKERHSARKFSTKKPDYRKVLEALDYARLAPLAGNIPTIRFILLQDKEKIEQIARASQQDFVATCNILVAVCSDDKLAKKSYEDRAERYARQQAGAVIENFLLKLTDLGLSTCWVGHFVDEEVKNILQVPEDVTIEALFPIGFEMIKTKQKRKQPLDSCIFFDVWKNRFMKPKIKPEAV